MTAAVRIEFEREKETKNAVRFKEKETGGAHPVVGTLYVQKSVAGNTKRLALTIEPLE